MLTFEPGDTLAHRLDPRTKLALQVAFAAAAYAHTTPRWLLGYTVLVGAAVVASGTPLRSTVVTLRSPIALLVAAPLLEGLTAGPPWFSGTEAWPAALAAYRVLLVLLVSAVFVRTTSVRDARAAIERVVPGRAGRFLGTGTGLVLRYLPLLVADLRRAREAMAARLGQRRSLADRMRIVGAAGANRAFRRADALALALGARCFSWNPTPPDLEYTRLDAGGWLVVAALVAAALA